MKALSSLKIAYKLPVFVVGFGVLLTAVIVTISTLNFQKSAFNQAEEHFESLIAGRKTALESLLIGINADLLTLAATPSTATALQRLSAAWSNLGADAAATVRQTYMDDNPHPLGERHILDRGKKTIPYNIHHAKFHPSFRTLLVAKGYYDAFLVNMSGDVIYSVYKEDDYGTNLLKGPYQDTDLANMFRDSLEVEAGKVIFSDIAPYAPSNYAPAAFVATKVVAASGQTVGVLILQVPVDLINSIMNDDKGIGETVEVFLAGPNLRARSNSRFEEGHDVLDQLPASLYLQEALADNSSFYPDTLGLRGQPVAAYAERTATFGTNWVIGIEQDRSELLAPVVRDRNLLLLASLVGAAIMSVVGWLFARSITNPLDRICRSMESVSSGNLDADVPEAVRGDEIGKIGQTLVSMQEDLQLAREAEEIRAEQQQQQQVVVENLSAGLLRLSKGDFSQPIDQAFSGEHEKLRSNFNQTIETLSGTVSQVIEASSSIRSGASEISQASEDLSHRTESQAATLEETAAALDELTASVKSAADGARRVENTMEEARQEAENSGEVVQSAVTAMTEIEQSSSSIAQIISVIDDIAFQTNLLALNAGVEAARAGEAGKGFAVVASEVRALAQRSSDAAMEIKTLIGDSSKQVERGVDLVGKAGDALHNIVERVSHISKLITGIAEGAVEQSTGLGEINTGVTQLDQVTQQNAAMVEEATAAGHTLNSDASKLAALVAGFKIAGVTHSFAAPADDVDVSVSSGPSAHGDDDWEIGEVTPAPAAMTEGSAAKDLWQDF
ncbi:methyl-accepting chemotaxis protein [Roseobacter sp. SK209-2-6]|uniref:methyl-accepting chemotaxis protein n=1 Tax=Roseobacter sp. SK209-2-6 TaxID=388739 RepID=UPI0000F3F527|nr:methyl-accepting chemotaxis protein [Roseobacter sp. SK209-2-6]EBA14687.1 methyl-accepting chemotaxis protein [Roseobacter sp. SK209-2-6]